MLLFYDCINGIKLSSNDNNIVYHIFLSSDKSSYYDRPTQRIFHLNIKPHKLNQFHSMNPFILFDTMEKQDCFLFSVHPLVIIHP